MPPSLLRNPPHRAEHIGSLKRPQKLLDSRGESDHPKAAEEEIKKLEDEAIKDIVAKQLDWGFSTITDGEYRRHMFWGDFWETLIGMELVKDPPASMFREYVPDIAAFLAGGHVPGESLVCTGKIKHPGKSTHVPAYEFVKALVPKEKQRGIKVTVPAPDWYHLRYREGQAYPTEVYPTIEDYLHDIAIAYQTEFDLLYQAGVRNVQLDDPNFAYFCSEQMIEGWKKDSANKYTTDELFAKYVKLYNDSLAKVPEDMHVGLHICRGNFVGSRHFSEGGYDRIATTLLKDLNVNTYFLEYDTPRAGGFEPLKSLPKHKSVILGVVTSKFPELEDKEKMRERIFSAADIIASGSGETREEALKRLGVSPQCGFASHAVGNVVTIEDMAKKMKLVRDIAESIWPGES